VADIDNLETCPSCKVSEISGNNRIIRARIFYGEKPDDAFFSQALGKVVSSKKAQSAEAKRRGWEELGDTDIDKHINRLEKDREQKCNSRWEELLTS
jgi:hypothetical protein